MAEVTMHLNEGEARAVREGEERAGRMQVKLLRILAVFGALVAILLAVVVSKSKLGSSKSARAAASASSRAGAFPSPAPSPPSVLLDELQTKQAAVPRTTAPSMAKMASKAAEAPSVAHTSNTPSPDVDPFESELAQATEWLEKALADHLNGLTPNDEEVHKIVASLTTFFEALDAKEPHDLKRIGVGIKRLQGIYQPHKQPEKVGTFVNNLGVYLSYLTRDENDPNGAPIYAYEALALLEESLQIRTDFHGEVPHPAVAETLNNIATVMHRANLNPKYAAFIGQQAFEIYNATLGPDHPRTVNAKEDWMNEEVLSKE